MSDGSGVFENGGAVRLVQRNGRYFAVADGLPVHASGASAAEALDALEARYRELAEFAAESGLPLSVVAPESGACRKRSWRGDLRRVVLIVATFALMMLPLSYALSTALTRAAANLKIQGGAEFWQGVEDRLFRAAGEGEALSAGKKDQITGALRVLVQRYKPYLDELRPLFTGDAAPRAPAPPPPAPGTAP